MFYVYLYHFGTIIFVFYSEAVVRSCSLNFFFEKIRKIQKKIRNLDSVFKVGLSSSKNIVLFFSVIDLQK